MAHFGEAVRVATIGGHVHLIGALEGLEVSAPLMPLLLKDVTVARNRHQPPPRL